MLRAAIYARKSTDDNDRHPENKSVERQVDHARRYAEAKGWTVAAEHLYVDDGVSGAEFANRHGLVRLLNHLRTFDVLVMSELSRLGREQWQLAEVLARVATAGVKIHLYLTGEEVKCESAVDKFMVSACSFGAELEREKASQRSRDALARKAQHGYNTGGRIYGYANVPVMVPSANGASVRSHVDFAIHEREAAVIRGIFQAYAAGYGPRAIARALNNDPAHAALLRQYFQGHAPPPPRKGTRSWAPSCVRVMLFNRRYTGVVPWGGLKKVLRGGKRTRVRLGAPDVLLAPRPDLRIVDDRLWAAVQQRLATTRKTYLRTTNGQVWGRAGAGTPSRYLLTGFARCGGCAANLVVLGGRHRAYGCGYAHHRGKTVCANHTREAVPRLERAVLAAIQARVLTPEAVAYTVKRALAVIAARHRAARVRPQHLAAERARVAKELANFMDVIARGLHSPTIQAEIETREARLRALDHELAAALAPATGGLEEARVARRLRDRLAEFTDLLRADVPRARHALSQLLVGPIRFEPVTVGGKRTFRFSGETTIGALLGEGVYSGGVPNGI